jgi:hypothetical protein
VRSIFRVSRRARVSDGCAWLCVCVFARARARVRVRLRVRACVRACVRMWKHLGPHSSVYPFRNQETTLSTCSFSFEECVCYTCQLSNSVSC